MSELAYHSIRSTDGYSSWTAHFRLPETLPRAEVLAEVHLGVIAMEYSPHIPLEKVEECGLSGVLIGPEGDDDAEMVQDIIFATDPSKRLGQRDAAESDQHAYRISEINEWVEIDDPIELAADNGADGLARIRVIMGRNKDQYKGKTAFTLQEARGLLRADTAFTVSGGYLFSDRPGWKEPYGEPALILKTNVGTYNKAMEKELFNVALGLNRQHRFVLETPWGAEVFEINPKYTG